MRLKYILFAALALGVAYSSQAQNERKNEDGSAYTVIANPGEKADSQVRINWHADLDSGKKNYCIYTKRSDTKWKKAKKIRARAEFCTAFDSLYSKKANGENFYEDAVFMRYKVELKGLEPDTEYMYRVGAGKGGQIRYFKTAPSSGAWSAAIISDLHSYTPLPKRLEAAMGMIGTLEKCNGGDFDIVLHVGDICAWGGSYSFWRSMYSEPYFSKYLWAGVNGNHDNMDRTSSRLSNDYFRYVNNNPDNGYDGEEGVCYHFTYGNALFIMLNSESMRSAEGLAAAQAWVRDVIKSNPAKYVVVMEHYQWFFGESGRTSQYGRWKDLFDECGVDLAIGANNHIYARTNAIYQGRETDGSKGTVYIQTPSSDNERGQGLKEWTDNKDLIKFRWTEGGSTVGAILLRADDSKLHLTLYDRNGNALDSVSVAAKR